MNEWMNGLIEWMSGLDLALALALTPTQTLAVALMCGVYHNPIITCFSKHSANDLIATENEMNYVVFKEEKLTVA